MTDKVQKIKEWISKTQDGLMDAQGNFENPSQEGAFHILSNLDYYIDSLQEQPVSEGLEEAADSYIKTHGEILGFGRQIFKAGAKWQKAKDESTTEDLGDYINKLSKQFPEVSFAKLSRIAVRVAKWQRQQDTKKLPKVTDRTELNDYAYQCAYDMSNDWAIENPTWHDVEDACKLGANWQLNKIRGKI